MIFAGPCAVESEEQAFKIARFVKENGATVFRAGCWKGQNRPFPNGKPAFWGLGLEALNILEEIEASVIPCATEVQSIEQAKLAIERRISYLQVGARHMQNFPLLQFLEKCAPPDVGIILKRGLGSTVDEWIGAAEHLGGPSRVILCERGIVSFDRTQTRWRLDFVAMAYIRQYTDYRIIADPSHGSGDRSLVPMLSRAALQIVDGLMLEVHYDPDSSPTDACQTIDFPTFKKIGQDYEKGRARHTE